MADILVKCECGVVLRAPPAAAGRRGKCQRCGKLLAIPTISGAPAEQILDLDAVDETWQLAEVGERTCSVCQTPIEAGAPQTMCTRCGLPFHSECWQENLGCSAYGCPNVNALKQGPDVKISAAAMQGAGGAALQGAAVAATVATPAASTADFPWEFLLLAGSALALLLGMFCYGAPSLVLAGASALCFVIRLNSGPRNTRLLVIAACALLSAGGTLFGLIVSFLYWQ